MTSEFLKAKWLHERKYHRGQGVVLGICLKLMLIKSWRFLLVEVLTTLMCIDHTRVCEQCL